MRSILRNKHGAANGHQVFCEDDYLWVEGVRSSLLVRLL